MIICPKCGNYGTAITESKIETEFGTIKYQRCNQCNIVSIDIDNLEKIVNSLQSKIEELESDNEELEEKKRLS